MQVAAAAGDPEEAPDRLLSLLSTIATVITSATTIAIAIAVALPIPLSITITITKSDRNTKRIINK